MKKDISVVIGPTAIGKSDFAIRSALDSGAEIISADAFQVYRGMDIGTAKVSVKEQKLVPHHLIDIRNPDQRYSVVDFLDYTKAIITHLRAKNKPIIICGGTGFYINAFIYSFEFPKESEKDLKVRDQINKELEAIGPSKLWLRLKEIDPKTAEIIDPNNSRRVVRALEVFYKNNQLPSALRKKTTKPRQDVKIIGLNKERELVYDQINKRVDKMISLGLIDEVKGLLSAGYPENAQAFEALGYKEVIQFLKGSIEKKEMIELVKKKTRHFAKRQMTWFNRFENVHWIKTP